MAIRAPDGANKEIGIDDLQFKVCKLYSPQYQCRHIFEIFSYSVTFENSIFSSSEDLQILISWPISVAGIC